VTVHDRHVQVHQHEVDVFFAARFRSVFFEKFDPNLAVIRLQNFDLCNFIQHNLERNQVELVVVNDETSGLAATCWSIAFFG